MKEIKIGNKVISEESEIFFVAEIGINHNGSLDIAKRLIDMDSMLDTDAVKFQKRTPEICVPEHKKNEIKETPWGLMTYLEYRKKLEFGTNEYREINEYCKSKKIIWFASVWDIHSIEFLEKFNVPVYKIPSAKLTDKELLEHVAKTEKPIFLSTGGSTLEQIKKAVHILEKTSQNPLVIMHCNSSYPANDNELNLKVIQILKKIFPNHIIGYSGHEKGITASIVAAVLGAKVIERHITLDRIMWGTDHAASLEFPGLRRLIRDLKKLPIWLGDGIKRVYESEKLVMEKLRNKDTL